jgi:hypothetical protein
MTDPDPIDPAAPSAPLAPVTDHAPPPPPAVRSARRGGTPLLLTLVLFLGLGGGLYYVWNNPKTGDSGEALAAVQRQVQAQSQAGGQQAAQIQTLSQQVQTLSDRMDKLEKAPAPQPQAAPDVSDIQQKIADLATKVAALETQPQAAGPAAASPSAPDNGADQQAMAALSQKIDQLQSTDKSAIDQAQADQKTALEQVQQHDKQALDQVQQQDKQALQQVQSNTIAQQQAMLTQEKTALDQLSGRIEKLEQGAGSVEDAASRATRLERVQAAVVALQAGQKLGDIPGAPPALVKFANVAPPTEAALRESFPALAAHAREVSQPQTAHETFLQRALARLQESVTVRQGDDVLVGDPAAGVLADAEVKVQNGDLAGAVQRLHALNGPAAAVMQPWVDKAESLIAARAALANLAARG